MRVLFVTLVLIFFASSIFCQNSSEDELSLAILHDSSKYIGKKISETDGKVKMQITTGDTITVHRIQAQKFYDENNGIVFSNGKFFKTTGYFFDFTFGFNANLFGGSSSVHTEYLFGRRITRQLDLAIGFGTEFNQVNIGGFDFDTQFATLFVQGKYFVFNTKPRPFVTGRIGYGGSAEAEQDDIAMDNSGGVNFQYGIGVQFAGRKRSRFHLSLVHYIQPASGTEFFLDTIGNEIETSFDLRIQRLILKLGWQF